MNYFSAAVKTATLLFALGFNAVYALTVNFDDEYNGVLSLKNNFNDADPLDPIENASSPSFNFAGGAVAFSGGVALRDPLDSTGLVGNVIIGDMGSVYYGTAYSPTTSIVNPNFQNKMTIDIDSMANFTSVSGLLVNGLNTNAIQNDVNALAGYSINYYSGADLLGSNIITDVPFTDGDTTFSFGFDTTSLVGALFGAAITKVEIMADDLDLNSTDMITQYEWDYLLAQVSFENTSPIPVPAALPLFISALLGGFVIARPKKVAK